MFWEKKLTKLYNQDQEERFIYSEMINLSEESWQAVKDRYVASYDRDPNDIFRDVSSGRQKKAQKLIKKRIRKILLNTEALGMAWLLVQHMDNDVTYQLWFLEQLPPDSLHRKYLYDRICINIVSKGLA